MSNKLKTYIKNKWVKVKCIWTSDSGLTSLPMDIECIVTNDERGKSLSIVTPHDGMYMIAFEQLEQYLK